MATGTVPARIALAGASFDSDKIECEPGTDSQRARLKMLAVDSDDLKNGWSSFTELDTGGAGAGAGNVQSDADGTKINGDGSTFDNGLIHTTGRSKKTGIVEVKVQFEGGPPLTYGWVAALADAGGAITAFPDLLSVRNRGMWYTAEFLKGSTFYHRTGDTLLGDVWYTLRFYIYDDPTGGGRDRIKVTVEGGTYTTETPFAELTVQNGLPATIYPEFFRYTNNGSRRYFLKDFVWYEGYATDDPVATLADIDSGTDDSTWDMSTIAFAGSETGLTFSYAYGNTASPSNWSAYKTLAHLQAESDPAGRYFKLRIKVSSDGATQREVTEGSIDCAVGIGSTASRPSATTADDETGTSFTLTISGDAGATHRVWHRAQGATVWTDAGTRTGDGDKQASGLSAGLYRWLVATENANGTGYGPAATGWVWVTTGDTSTEIQKGLLDILGASNTLTSALGGAGRVYLEHPPQGRVLPCAAYTLDGALNPALGPGTRELWLEIEVWAATHAKTREVEEVLDELLNDLAYETTHWRARLLTRSVGTSRAMRLSGERDPVYRRRLAWRVYVRPIGS